MMIRRYCKHDQVVAFAINIKGGMYGGDKVNCTHCGKIGMKRPTVLSWFGTLLTRVCEEAAVAVVEERPVVYALYA